jgi:hypothetical protein
MKWRCAGFNAESCSLQSIRKERRCFETLEKRLEIGAVKRQASSDKKKGAVVAEPRRAFAIKAAPQSGKVAE